MGRRRTKVDYRRLYKEHFGIDFGPEMVVHHIDFDRTNNDIGNLLLLPRELHARYHFYVTTLGGDGTGIINLDVRIDSNTYRNGALKGLGETLNETVEWISVKSNMQRMRDAGVKW